jgi:2OG-Fe(II) oxygenase superfamily
MKKETYDNFVGIYDNYFSAEYCDNLIEYFEWCKKHNRTWTRTENEIYKSDESTTLNPTNMNSIEFTKDNLHNLFDEFNDVFWNQCYRQYYTKFGTLQAYSGHTVYSYKIQKTLPGEGYHIWHCEDAQIAFSRRIGVYMLYLNDVEEGGETEFLYLNKRISPAKGRLLIWPPNFPWTHRGNPPLSGTKYVMTGWIEFN